MGISSELNSKGALFCFSHLRWKFVFQRPQHLMSRFAKTRPVYYWEEPVCNPEVAVSRLAIEVDTLSGVTVVTPMIPAGEADPEGAGRRLLNDFVKGAGIFNPVLWFYTPMMWPLCEDLAEAASVVVYDCMDELANFAFAPPELLGRERDLIARADLVFTGGYSLYEAKRHLHADIHPFPSSVDVEHFAAARALPPAQHPTDQAAIPHPRIGFYGVLDERLDQELLEALADARPDLHIVMVGPVVKIDPDALPQRANVHYLGAKTYAQLPSYLAGWDAAMMPFADNEATRFISPTKTPEYLAGGRPVVSTAITDVQRHYGDLDGVWVTRSADEFIAACDEALSLKAAGDDWLHAVDAQLARQSWNRTFQQMSALVDKAEAARRPRPILRETGPIIAAPATWASKRASHYDCLVVGAGFAGAVMAERLAAASGKKVLVVDKRPHVAGNAYDAPDAAGVRIHVYGPHIFHTNSDEVFEHLSRFTQWRPYEHRVLAHVRDRLVPMPINRTTLNDLFDASLSTDEEARAFLASRAEQLDHIRTSEDVVVSAVGRELYELFFRGYTRKQWGLDPSELDRSVTARVPTRTSTDDRYFNDRIQAMPAQGYTAMFERMLDHENITVATGTTFQDVADDVLFDRLVFTGPVDEFFDHRFGPLPYRSLRFEHRTLDEAQHQPVAVVNYPDEATPYTRISEYKHLTGQVHPKTSITLEYPSDKGDPYYPIPNAAAQALYKKYEALALARPDVDFVGRLATYRYYNMDQVVGQALATWRKGVGAGRAAPSYREVQLTAAT